MAAAVVLLALLLLGLLLSATSRDEARPPTTASSRTTTTNTTTTTTTTTTAAPTAALPVLRIAVPNGIPPYHRQLFGETWTDDDHDCQDTRTEVLIQQSRPPASLNGCDVVAGEWLDPWSGVVTTTPGTLDIDHTVALGNAWRSGAWAWSADRRLAFANDLKDAGQLIAIPASENRAKSDDGPEDWRPPDRSSWCHYAQNWVAIKQRWDLSATPAEWTALMELATTC